MATHERTERQRKAEAALDDAVRELRAADYEAHEDDDVGVLAEWVLIGMEVGTNAEGSWSSRFRITPEGGDLMPVTHVLGLLRGEVAEIEGRLAYNYAQGGD